MIKKNKWAAGLLIGMALAAPMRVSQAALPVVDPAAIAQIIADLEQTARLWLEEKGLIIDGMEQEEVLHQEQIENNNNNTAQTVTRVTQTMSDLYNLETAREMAPSPTACGTASKSEALAAVKCETTARSAAKSRSGAARKASATPGSPQAITEEILEDIKAVDRLAPGDNLPVRADNFLGASTGPVFDEAQGLGAEAFVKLVSPEELPPPDTRRYRDDSPEGQAYTVKRLTKLARRSVAEQSLEQIKNERMPNAEGVSKMQVIDQFVNERFGDGLSSEWMMGVTATAGAGSMTEAQVIREMAIMDAFLSYMSVERHKQSLRIETLLATLLTETIEQGE